jgi:hypothetical protein
MLDSEYRGAMPLERLRPECRLAYKFFGTLKPGDTFTNQELLDYVLGKLRRTPGANLVVAKNRLKTRLANGFPGVESLGAYNGSDVTKTRVTIHPDHTLAIKDLMRIVSGVREGDEDVLSQGRQAAEETINDTDRVSLLMAKAFRFSGNAQSKGAQRNAQIVRAVVEASPGPLTKVEVTQRVQAQGVRLGARAVSTYLRSLHGAGEIHGAREPRHDADRRELLRYSRLEA